MQKEAGLKPCFFLDDSMTPGLPYNSTTSAVVLHKVSTIVWYTMGKYKMKNIKWKMTSGKRQMANFKSQISNSGLSFDI